MFSISGTVVPVVIGIIALWLGAKVLSIRMSPYRMVVIAFLAQFLIPYFLGFFSSMLSMLPFSMFFVRWFIWVGLIKFTADRVSIMHALFLGSFAFAMVYFVTVFGPVGYFT